MIRKYRVYGRGGIDVMTILSEDEKNVYHLPDGRPESNENYFNTFVQAKARLIKEQREFIERSKENLRLYIKSEKLKIKNEESRLDSISEYASP